MTKITKAGTGAQHIPTEAPVAKKQLSERARDAVIDRLDRFPGGHRLDPHEMKKHIDHVLEGPWGPIGAQPLYAVREPPRDRPFPGDIRPMYGVEVNPKPILPPDIQPLYAVDIGPKPIWPPNIQPLYAVDIGPTPIREPPIRAMYGIDLGDNNLLPRKA